MTRSTLVVTGIVASVALSRVARSTRAQAQQSPNVLQRDDELSKADFYEFLSTLSLGVGVGAGIVGAITAKP